MAWGCETRRTAKFSIEARALQIRRADTILDCLGRIRQRAIEHASDAAIIASAPDLPLPAPSPSETEWLEGPLEVTASSPFDWDENEEDATLPLHSDDGTEELPRQIQEEQEPAEAPLNPLLTPWEETVLCDLTICLMSIEAQNEETESLLLYKNGATEHWVLDQCAQAESDAAPTLLSDFLELHPILAFPIIRSSCSSSGSCSYYSSSDDESSTGPSAEESCHALARNGHSSTCFLDLPAAPEISSNQLAKLGQFIQHVEQFRNYLETSLNEARKSYRVQGERWRGQGSGGNMANLLKSRGYSSPLSQCIAVDEEWPSEWDLCVCDTRSIYDKYVQTLDVDAMAPAEEKKPAREPKW